MNPNIIDEVREAQVKATKYENLRTRYIEVAKELAIAEAHIKKAKEMMDPVTSIQGDIKRVRAPRKKVAEALEAVYKKLQMGLEVRKETLVKDYPDVSAQYIMKLLSQKKDLDSRREGRAIIYFSKKNY